MSELYRKWGRSVRREGQHLLFVDEAGEATESHGIFRTRALGDALDLADPDSKRVEAAAAEIESMVERPLMIERLFVNEGVVAHQFGEVRWRENIRRVHLSIARPPLRAIFDFAEFRFDALRRVLPALMRAGKERKPARRIRVAEHVGAALLPLTAIAKLQSTAPHDGKGEPIREQLAEHEPPNWFRPSYRVRPRKAWFHLRVAPFGAIDEDVPEAVALLAPVSRREIRALCVDGGAAYPVTLPLRPIIAAWPTATWYPFGAGAFGAELML
ncbi:MAG TPA: hypothetical protein VER58_21130 [Thermoanaerobaculia bacterium]|nr:hypothetical protein [Thermoanaerobaculia bacterium]